MQVRQQRRDLDETVDLAVPDGAGMRFVDQLPAPQRLRAASAVGEVFPLHCTANGKALLAAMSEERALALLPARLASPTPSTIASRGELLDELEAVRRKGVAYDREEHTEGICAVGAAVFDATGPVAAISVPVPTQRFAGREDELAHAVRQAAAAASRLLDGPLHASHRQHLRLGDGDAQAEPEEDVRAKEPALAQGPAP